MISIKNKVYSSKTMLSFGVFGICVVTAFFVLSSILLVVYFGDANMIQKMMYISFVILFFSGCFFSTILLNRIGCIVWVDDKTNEICRKGFFFGFGFRLKIDKIKDIVVATIPKQTKFIVIIDDENRSFEGLSKRSFIRLEYNPANLKFIGNYWKKPIDK